MVPRGAGTLLLLADAIFSTGHAADNDVVENITLKIPPCGVAKILDEGGEEPDWCDVEMITNCTVSFSPIKCPEKCPYIVPSFEFPCLFRCVKGTGDQYCAAFNPDRPFLDIETKVCRRCNVDKCMECSERDKCKKCHKLFQLSHDQKSCEFKTEQVLHLNLVLGIVGILLLALIVLAVIWVCIHGPHKNIKMHQVSVNRALRHRHLSKSQDWNLTDTKAVRKFHSIWTNVHTENLVGVGLPLFYNDICFMIFIAMIFFITTSFFEAKYYPIHVLGKFETGWTLQEEQSIELHKYLPVKLYSALSVCSEQSGATVDQQLYDFARAKCYFLAAMYAVTFLISVRYGKFQLDWAYKFDEENVTMADYAIKVTGLPETETDEAELRKWFEEELRRVLPDKFQRPVEVVHVSSHEADERRDREASALEVNGVSICYNYLDRQDELHDALWNLIELMEVDLQNKATSIFAQDNAEDSNRWVHFDHTMTSACKTDKTLDQVRQNEKERVMSWFNEGPTKLRGCGSAYVVFNYIQDKDEVLRYYNKHPGFLTHPRSKTQQCLKLDAVFSEPTTIHWWHFGYTTPELIPRTFKTFGKIVLMVAMVQLVVVFPYCYFIVLPYSRTGSANTGLSMQVAGFLLGNINGFLFWNLHMFATRIGYSNKDSMDMFALFANTGLCAVMTITNLAIIVYMVRNQTKAGLDSNGWTRWLSMDLKNLGTLALIGQNLYNTMMPGTFFMGLIMTALNAGPIIMLWKHFLMKVIYIWRALPDFLLKLIKPMLPWAPPTLDHYPFRSAELGQDPWEIAILGNYADHIVTPSLCFGMYVCVGPSTVNVFRGMLMWGVFEYVYFRWLHLRYSKNCHYSTGRMDSFARMLWGCPLSILALASCLWGIRAKVILPEAHTWVKIMLLFTTFVISWMLWVGAYLCFCRPFDLNDADEKNKEKTVDEVKNRCLYSWFNCNPAFVLKCEYYLPNVEGENEKYNLVDEDGEEKEGKDEEEGEKTAQPKKHPIACGIDPTQVRYYERGKEYLFVKPDRQPLVDVKFTTPLEFEFWMEKMFGYSGLARRFVMTTAKQHKRVVTEQAAAIANEMSALIPK